MSSADRRIDVPLEARIKIAHAVLQAIADAHRIDLLHIKGYAAGPGVYAEGRRSTDADVLVRPADAQRWLRAIEAHGWEPRTSFRSGSIFRHAAAHWHADWGWVDSHRDFPGIGLAPARAFERLWAERTSRPIAGIECTVPAQRHERIIAVIHEARASDVAARDAPHLLEMLGETEIAELAAEADRLEAGMAWAAATGTLDRFGDDPQAALWRAYRSSAGRAELLAARLTAAPGPFAKARILLSAAVPSSDHLRMRLDREPQLRDYARELGLRAGAAAEALRGHARRIAGGARAAARLPGAASVRRRLAHGLRRAARRLRRLRGGGR